MPQPSLPLLRWRSSAFVRRVHRYYAAVRLLPGVHAGRAASAFAHRSPSCGDTREVSRFSCRKYRGVLWGLRLRRTVRELALSLPSAWPSAQYDNVGVLIGLFSELDTQPASSPPLRFTTGLATCRAKDRGRVVRYSFLVRNFHPLLPAGLSRRFPYPKGNVSATALNHFPFGPHEVIVRS